jgi:hypothetical protein
VARVTVSLFRRPYGGLLSLLYWKEKRVESRPFSLAVSCDSASSELLLLS